MCVECEQGEEVGQYLQRFPPLFHRLSGWAIFFIMCMQACSDDRILLLLHAAALMYPLVHVVM